MDNSDNSPDQQNGWIHLKGGVGLVVMLGVFLLELSGCNSHRTVSDKDFSGHTFTAAIADSADRFDLRRPGSSVNEHKVEFQFTDKNSGQISIQQGQDAKRLPFTWQVAGDSLLVTMNDTINGLLIQKDPNGYSLSNKHLTIMLTR
ncbi:MAG: hypothetical protein JWP57_4743 [Spirosoma sp.]|nr:hypothetical protein [Spirosoma sp.]